MRQEAYRLSAKRRSAIDYATLEKPADWKSLDPFLFASFLIEAKEEITLTWQGNREPRDFIKCGSHQGLILASGRMVQEFQLHEINGFDFYPAKILNLPAEQAYFVLRFPYVFASLCYQQVRPAFTSYLEFYDPVVQGIDFNVSDVWIGPGYKGDPYYIRTFVSPKFKNLAKRHKWKGIEIGPLCDLTSHGKPEDTTRFLCES